MTLLSEFLRDSFDGWRGRRPPTPRMASNTRRDGVSSAVPHRPGGVSRGPLLDRTENRLSNSCLGHTQSSKALFTIVDPAQF